MITFTVVDLSGRITSLHFPHQPVLAFPLGEGLRTERQSFPEHAHLGSDGQLSDKSFSEVITSYSFKKRVIGAELYGLFSNQYISY